MAFDPDQKRKPAANLKIDVFNRYGLRSTAVNRRTEMSTPIPGRKAVDRINTGKPVVDEVGTGSDAGPHLRLQTVSCLRHVLLDRRSGRIRYGDDFPFLFTGGQAHPAQVAQCRTA